MHVGKTWPHLTSTAPESTTAQAASVPPSTGGGREAAAPQRTDTVRILASGRAVAKGNVPFGPDRIAEIRGRISDGTYDDPATLSETARRIQASGDLA